MRPGRVVLVGISIATLFANPVKPDTVEPQKDARDRLRDTITEATCADASRPAKTPQITAPFPSDISINSLTSRTLFFVSPDGNDAWSGSSPEPNSHRSDGPFATLEKARDAARDNDGDSAIAIGDGDYYLAQPILFDSRDAGLVITARCGATPVLHGGPRVSGWLAQSDGRWTAPLKLPHDKGLGDLFVNGSLQVQARFPNAPIDEDPTKGWLFAAKCGPDVKAGQGNTSFCFHAGDLPDLKDATALVANIVGGFYPGSQWGSDTLPVVAINRETRTVHTLGTPFFFTAEGSRYFLTRASDFLDAPGEWRYDSAAEKIEHIPADQNFQGATVIAAVLPTFFKLEGADDVVIAGLQFRHGAPQGSGKFLTETRGFGAIRLEHSDRVMLLGNRIDHVGVGIHVSESENVLIAGNVIGDVAGNGIYVGTTFGSFGKSNGARILSNHIYDVGKTYYETAGISFQATDNIHIAHNLIENTAQFGIGGGSAWGQQDAVHNAVIEYNVIRNANQKTADGGAIKMMGEQKDLLNSTIRYNRVSRTGHLMNRADGTFWPLGYESTTEWPSPISWAIYTDGKASGVRIEGNTLLENVSAIGINGGWNNVVTGNVIARGSGAAFRIDDGTGRGWRPPWARPNRIEDNDVSVDGSRGPVAFVNAADHGLQSVQFVRNRYRGALGNRSFQVNPGLFPQGNYTSLNDLQKAGIDQGSVVLEPNETGKH